MIYFARLGQDGLVKIGHSTTAVPRRISGDGLVPLHVFRIIAGGVDVKLTVHDHFASLKVEEDWFRYSPNMLSPQLGENLFLAPDESTLDNFITLWYKHFGTAPTEIRRVLRVALEEDPILQAALAALAPGYSDYAHPHFLKTWLFDHENRVLGGYRLVREPGRGWRLRPAPAAATNIKCIENEVA
jgi:hypothetical protein